MKLQEEKSQLRGAMKRQLASLKEQEARRAGDRLRERALDLPELASAGGVLACLSFGHEIDTRGLVGCLLERRQEVYVPRVSRRSDKIFLHRFPCPLVRLTFGLEQPRPEEPALAPEQIDDRIDVALILGLAFDRDLFRLGYGGGYFDRFLASRQVLPIGLAFDAQIVEQVPREGHDIPMQLVVTETATWRPGGS